MTDGSAADAPYGMRRFDDKVVLVTGAASGIGRAVARRLGAEGGSVACLDLAVDGATKTADAIVSGGGAATAIECNVTDEASVVAAVAAAIDAYGRLDVVCNVAGIGGMAKSHEETLDQWDRILGVNLTGTFLVCRETIPALLESGGVLVNTASTAGLMGHPWSAAYCASKGGVVQLTRALAYEYRPSPMRVVAVSPGGVETPIMDAFAAVPEGENWKMLKKAMTERGFCQPDDVASCYAYLASDEAHYMTGSIVTYDGGIIV
jgi:NAD(P)-dependent dehydrogenase (short-subunit alcohol dehydrogenase family)